MEDETSNDIQDYYSLHGLFAEDLHIVLNSTASLDARHVKLIPFYKVYLEQSVNNHIFYEWTGYGMDERIALGLTDDKPVELIALRLLLDDPTLDFLRLPIRDLDTSAPLYIGKDNFIFTSHPRRVNPSYAIHKSKPEFYIYATDLVIDLTKYQTGTTPQASKTSIRAFSDTDIEQELRFWQDKIENGILFTDPCDFNIPGMNFYGSQVEKELAMPSTSMLRKLARIRVAIKGEPPLNFPELVFNKCAMFSNCTEDVVPVYRKLAFTFSYHSPIGIDYENAIELHEGSQSIPIPPHAML
ncbi:hypothetical protein HDE_12487 [Halotydeus destructor]|nr:hypothetical protein HDE_12487 [Halotydeus destructor]